MPSGSIRGAGRATSNCGIGLYICHLSLLQWNIKMFTRRADDDVLLLGLSFLGSCRDGQECATPWVKLAMQNDGLLMWRGKFLNRPARVCFQWGQAGPPTEELDSPAYKKK